MTVNKGIIQALQKEFGKYDKPENKMDYQRWFKEKLKNPIGFKGPIIKKVANEVFKQAKNIPKKDLLDSCETLYKSDRPGESGAASIWTLKISKQFTKSDFIRFESWLKKYVDNWSRCATFCGGFFGELIVMYPDLVTKTQKWTKLKNRWLRRASAVILIPSLKRTDNLIMPAFLYCSVNQLSKPLSLIWRKLSAAGTHSSTFLLMKISQLNISLHSVHVSNPCFFTQQFQMLHHECCSPNLQPIHLIFAFD